jgi:hypothetical protein
VEHNLSFKIIIRVKWLAKVLEVGLKVLNLVFRKHISSKLLNDAHRVNYYEI